MAASLQQSLEEVTVATVCARARSQDQGSKLTLVAATAQPQGHRPSRVQPAEGAPPREPSTYPAPHQLTISTAASPPSPHISPRADPPLPRLPHALRVRPLRVNRNQGVTRQRDARAVAPVQQLDEGGHLGVEGGLIHKGGGKHVWWANAPSVICSL